MNLYAPYIDGTIPAFTFDRLVIPFLMNPAVSPAQVKGFKVKVIDLSSPDQEETVITTKKEAFDVEKACADGQVILVPAVVDSMACFTSGTSYKIQLAYYENSSEETVWSSVGVGRCIGAPSISIKGLQTAIVNSNIVSYAGQYVSQHISEPVYSYSFTLVDQETQEVIQTTEELTHNAAEDTIVGSSRISQDNFYLCHDLEEDRYYVLTYEITTVNGYNTGVSYIIKGNAALAQGFKCAVNAKLNKDYGYVEVSLSETTDDIRLARLAIQRREVNDSKWDTLIEVLISNKTKDTWDDYCWRDFSVEAGKSYLYSAVEFAIDQSYQVRQYAKRENISEEVIVDFEDIILSDNEHVLRVAFNPKISSFKKTVQEQKVDTLGSKYPFFFRNGQVEYAELPISGLISYQLDPDELFMTLSRNKKDTTPGIVYGFGIENAGTNGSRGAQISIVKDKNTPQNVAFRYTKAFFSQMKEKTKYTFSFDHKCKNGSASIKFVPYRKPGSDFEGENWEEHSFDSSTEWATHSIEFTTGTNIPSNVGWEFGIQMTMNPNAAMDSQVFSFDNFKLMGPEGVNLMQNGNFEQGAAGWTLYLLSGTVKYVKSKENPSFMFTNERDFKMEVLKWLNNGRPKLVRSAAEGNYLVRLMNVSLSPEDKLSRMLHTFSATGYEIADASDYETLKDFQVLNCEVAGKKESVIYGNQ